MSIRRIIEGVIEREGGYSDNPDDLGGATMYGITEAVAREWDYQGAMRNLPRSLAFRIYEHDYYTRPGFHLVHELSEAIAEELVDSGVNLGPEWPSLWLQQSLNALNRQQEDYDDIATDGAVGPATAGALRAYLDLRGKEGEAVMLTALNCYQGARYLDLSLARERNETFTYGWLANRVVI